MRRMKAAPACATLNYVSLLSSPWKSRKLRTASSPRRTSRLRPFGLSTLGIRDTGQKTSKAQDAFRSLHYVAVTCLPSSACPYTISLPIPHFWGQTPWCVGPDPKKSVKTPCYSDILREYRINGRKCKSVAKYSQSYLASLKKGLIFSREARKCAGEDKAYFRFMRRK